MRFQIAILTGNHLCHNPRVFKEAAALANAGYRVEVLGAWVDPALKAQDIEIVARAPFTFSPVVDFTSSRFPDRLRGLKARALVKSGRLAGRAGILETSWQLGRAVTALRRAARRSAAQLFIAHSEAGMLAADDMRRLGRRVGVDMEDWFSEDLLPEARILRPLKLLRRLEHDLLRAASHSSCPSEAMSRRLAEVYGCRPPVVVYNAFPWTDRHTVDGATKDQRDRSRVSVHWYSQTLGPGRGLEDLFAALPHLRHDVAIHLRGRQTSDCARWMQSHLPEPWRRTVTLHDVVDNDELLSRIAEHDIGFAGEQTYCASRDLTITNKILHYLLGGLAVVASDTTGQREVASAAPGAVTLYAPGNAVSLAEALNPLLASPVALRRAKAAALGAAERHFSWEIYAERLVNSVETALCSTVS